jgi:hypothetical protein
MIGLIIRTPYIPDYKSWETDKPYSIFRLHLVRYNLGKTVKKWLPSQINSTAGPVLRIRYNTANGNTPEGVMDWLRLEG